MAAEYVDIEVVVVVDAAGDYGVGIDADGAREQYEENIGAFRDADGFRTFTMTLKVPLPTPIKLTGEVSVDETATALTVS